MSTVLITGAARGLGFEFTKLYAAKGWKIHACARNPDGMKGIAGDIHPHELEVTDYEAVTALAGKLSGEAIDVARAIVDVAASAYMTGQVVAIDGGMTLR